MSEKQEESEDRSYIQKGDIVLVNRGLYNSLCKVISKSTNKADALYVHSITDSYISFDVDIDKISLLIPKENLPFQYKMEDDMLFLAYKDGQLVMSMHCPTHREYCQTQSYAQYMSDIYALRYLKETCKDEAVLKIIKDRNI